MPRNDNIIQYRNCTDQNLLLNLADSEDCLRDQIEDFVNIAHGVQLQRGAYWLRFKDSNNVVRWIAPTYSIRRAFTYARSILNGRALVMLEVFQLFLKLEKNEGYCSDFR